MPETSARELDRLFAMMPKVNASDLHLKVGSKPMLRVAGAIREVETEPLTAADVRRMVLAVLDDEQKRQFQQDQDLDFAYSVPQVGRFRVNLFMQRGAISMAARRVNTDVPNFKSANLPQVFEKIAANQQGLALVCGITGSGKSTTLAALIDFINATRRSHIVTVEDPIEYLYRDKKSFINQREVGIDVKDFRTALRYVVRQDPDVILVGEMRDPETFETGLTAAETGHLVFGTLHSSTVAQTFGRILDMFPPDRESLVRHSLAFNLRAIVAQKLLPSIKQGVDRVPLCEIMIATPTIQKLIREGEDKKIGDAIRGGDDTGMQDFTQGLVKLVNSGLVSKKVAFAHAPNAEALKMRLQGIDVGDDHRILGD